MKEDYPPQGLSEARRGKRFLKLSVSDPPRGRPFGGGGVHHEGNLGSMNTPSYFS